jgi:hypothetical protein
LVWIPGLGEGAWATLLASYLSTVLALLWR